MKRLQLVRKKLLPLLLCVAVAGSQVPVMAADVGGFSDSAEGFNEEWSEDTQTQPAEAEDTTETAEENTTENTGIPDEQTEDIAEAADRDTEDIALQSSGEDTETPEISEGSSFDSQEDTFGDGEESFGDASDSGESGIEYIKGRPLTEEEEQEQLEKVCRKLLKLFAWEKASPSDIRFRLASSMLSLNKKKEAGDFCERWYGEDENDPAAAAALIYAWIADRRYKDAQKVVDFWMDKEGGYTEENAEVFGAAAVLQNVFPGNGKDIQVQYCSSCNKL